MLLIRTFLVVIPALLIWVYVKDFQQWGTKERRNVVGIGVGLLWAVVFGIFSGMTGFLR